MTQEEKQILIQDLCARLPYFTKVQIKNEIVVLDSICDDDGYHFNFINDDIEGVNIENIKPYLFPMSNMSEEQRKEFIQCAGYEAREEENGYHYETYYYDLVGHENVIFPDCDGFNWLNKNHFDYRRLIEKGLAIDASNLNIY